MENRDLMKIIAWTIHGDTGISSKAILTHMLGLVLFSDNMTPPSDQWDRARCIKLLKLIPEWIGRLEEMKQYAGWLSPVELIKEEM